MPTWNSGGSPTCVLGPQRRRRAVVTQAPPRVAARPNSSTRWMTCQGFLTAHLISLGRCSTTSSPPSWPPPSALRPSPRPATLLAPRCPAPPQAPSPDHTPLAPRTGWRPQPPIPARSPSSDPRPIAPRHIAQAQTRPRLRRLLRGATPRAGPHPEAQGKRRQQADAPLPMPILSPTHHPHQGTSPPSPGRPQSRLHC
jgi:hypothetical protein